MRARLVLFASSVTLLTLAGCGAAPYVVIRDPEHARATEPEAETTAVATSLEARPFARELAVASAPDGPATPLDAEVVPGIERAERIVVLDGATCATRAGKAPICIGSTPRLDDARGVVKRVEAAGDTTCVLFEGGKLTCTRAIGPVNAPVGVFGGHPRASEVPLFSHAGIADVRVVGSGDVVELARGGKVTEAFAPTSAAFALFDDAVELAIAGDRGQLVCARERRGDVRCARLHRGHVEPRTVAGLDADVLQLERSFARTKDGSIFVLGLEGARDPFVATRVARKDGFPLLALELASTDTLCALTPERGVRCLDADRSTDLGVAATRDVRLPGVAKGFRPAGAPCVELASGLAACWGSELDRMRELGGEIIARTAEPFPLPR